ncbi:hypothetical protein [Amycolatopsis solani]|uniref:hypothetical protein n=1 Tax=Amycolatopsis solani TaxID=3028615 RepID=UPI0025AF8476|nr:hypothetical protein [Amycolatopsis sp. MEP2-6]
MCFLTMTPSPPPVGIRKSSSICRRVLGPAPVRLPANDIAHFNARQAVVSPARVPRSVLFDEPHETSQVNRIAVNHVAAEVHVARVEDELTPLGPAPPDRGSPGLSLHQADRSSATNR